MGAARLPAQMLGIPTYYISHTTEEDLGNGNVLIRNYSRRNGVLVHEFNGIIASPNLALASQRFAAFVQALVDKEPWRLGAKVH